MLTLCTACVALSKTASLCSFWALASGASFFSLGSAASQSCQQTPVAFNFSTLMPVDKSPIRLWSLNVRRHMCTAYISPSWTAQ